jgi:hypothetical protein
MQLMPWLVQTLDYQGTERGTRKELFRKLGGWISRASALAILKHTQNKKNDNVWRSRNLVIFWFYKKVK